MGARAAAAAAGIAALAGTVQFWAGAALPIDDPSRLLARVVECPAGSKGGSAWGLLSCCVSCGVLRRCRLRAEAMLTARIAQIRTRPKPIARSAWRLCNNGSEKESAACA